MHSLIWLRVNMKHTVFPLAFSIAGKYDLWQFFYLLIIEQENSLKDRNPTHGRGFDRVDVYLTSIISIGSSFDRQRPIVICVL